MKTPLPLEWVDKIFTKLTLVYGRDFSSRWEGMNIADVKVDWAHELSGFQDNGKAIAHALQNLPAAKPPTVLEFRALAQKCPSATVVLPPSEPASVEVVAEGVATLRRLRGGGSAGNKDWARRIVDRHERGDKIRPYSLKLAQSALRARLAVE